MTEKTKLSPEMAQAFGLKLGAAEAFDLFVELDNVIHEADLSVNDIKDAFIAGMEAPSKFSEVRIAMIAEALRLANIEKAQDGGGQSQRTGSDDD